MPIREMTTDDLTRVSQICYDAFNHSVANTVLAEGRDNFYHITAPDTLAKLIAESSNTALVYEQDQQLLGILLLKQGRHLSLLFVDPKVQGQGIGKALIHAMLPYCSDTSVTVRASLPSVKAYQHYGFVCTGVENIESGLTYQPMERLI
ncbi:GNAT family N-acetyltransferase [Marinomonas ostreistagni]|uniref:GNAT family N-acetyltransferase n=1 Tax=Marinomonas ostreistagni TaxID=359209 RepID=UPI00194DC394|nr:GNAT family N-acetyltransferase [Marinomonas ostreistagni]MBM6552033.1 GNAT family N-acetyltransferase [Marinomonas ostreistagni]